MDAVADGRNMDIETSKDGVDNSGSKEVLGNGSRSSSHRTVAVKVLIGTLCNHRCLIQTHFQVDMTAKEPAEERGTVKAKGLDTSDQPGPSGAQKSAKRQGKYAEERGTVKAKGFDTSDQPGPSGAQKSAKRQGKYATFPRLKASPYKPATLKKAAKTPPVQVVIVTHCCLSCRIKILIFRLLTRTCRRPRWTPSTAPSENPSRSVALSTGPPTFCLFTANKSKSPPLPLRQTNRWRGVSQLNVALLCLCSRGPGGCLLG